MIQSQQERCYRCKRCGKTFAATAGTVFSRLQTGWDLVTGLAAAYRAVVALLDDDRLSYAWSRLWEAGTGEQRGRDRRTPGPRARELLRLSLLLESPAEALDHRVVKAHPVPTGMLRPDGQSTRPWRGLRLHRWFAELPEGQDVVHRVIRDDLLPRFALGEARRLAAARARAGGGTGRVKRTRVRQAAPSMRANTPAAASTRGSGFITFVLGARELPWMLAVLLAAAVVVAFAPFLAWSNAPAGVLLDGRLPTLAGGVLQYGLPAFVLARAVALGRDTVPLLLPRLLAAIIAAYLAIPASDEAWRMAGALGVAGGRLAVAPVAGLWAACLGLAMAYFFHEARVYTGHWRPAAMRAFDVTLWSVVLGMSIGAWALQLRGAGEASWEQIAGAPMEPLLGVGPRLADIPLPALLVFAPLVVVVGVIAQLLWQEKPVTASAWLQEER